MGRSGGGADSGARKSWLSTEGRENANGSATEDRWAKWTEGAKNEKRTTDEYASTSAGGNDATAGIAITTSSAGSVSTNGTGRTNGADGAASGAAGDAANSITAATTDATFTAAAGDAANATIAVADAASATARLIE